MSDSNTTNGGANATRGLLVQALVALLDLLNPSQQVVEITLEPKVGNDQFDFLWINNAGAWAKQVKSSINPFHLRQVKVWANEMKKQSPGAQCSLVLIGPASGGLTAGEGVNGVLVELHTLNLDGLIAQAAHRLAEFLEQQGLPSGNTRHQKLLVHALESKLQHLAAGSRRFSRGELVRLLREWISSCSKSEVGVILRVSCEEAQMRILARITLGNELLKASNALLKKVTYSTGFEPPRSADKQEHDRHLQEFRIWDEFNRDLLRQDLFASAAPCNEYTAPIPAEPTFCVFIAEIELHQAIVNERILRLTSLIERLPLFSPRDDD